MLYTAHETLASLRGGGGGGGGGTLIFSYIARHGQFLEVQKKLGGGGHENEYLLVYEQIMEMFCGMPDFSDICGYRVDDGSKPTYSEKLKVSPGVRHSNYPRY